MTHVSVLVEHTMVFRIQLSLYGGSLEITITVPLRILKPNSFYAELQVYKTWILLDDEHKHNDDEDDNKTDKETKDSEVFSPPTIHFLNQDFMLNKQGCYVEVSLQISIKAFSFMLTGVTLRWGFSSGFLWWNGQIIIFWPKDF